METWSEADVRAVHREGVRLGAGNPRGAERLARVRDWYRHVYGDAPARHDATGRLIDPRPVRPIPKGGPVRVRAHVRDGGEVHVDAHQRSSPAR